MPRASLLLLVVTLATGLFPRAAMTATGPDLRTRISIDGSTGDFLPEEAVFGLTGSGQPEEPPDDSVWGWSNDVRQIRVTWDRRRLYLAVEATIWGNNVVLAADVVPGAGLTRMTHLNSWRRAFVFGPPFAPDLMGATWDGNAAPRLLLHVGPDVVSDNVPGPLFSAVATFYQGQPDRAMELSIPWSTVFPGATRDTVLGPAPDDSATVIPPGAALHLAAFVTTGADGWSGPDSAPNNLTGHPSDVSITVTIDNFAIVPIDEDADGLADMNVPPRARVTFHDPSTPARATSWGKIKNLYR
jgi:hypothetical protein